MLLSVVVFLLVVLLLDDDATPNLLDLGRSVVVRPTKIPSEWMVPTKFSFMVNFLGLAMYRRDERLAVVAGRTLVVVMVVVVMVASVGRKLPLPQPLLRLLLPHHHSDDTTKP